MYTLEIPENTAYNPMIYITFFIVILISKRGVREAERERERENHITVHRTIHRMYIERTTSTHHAAQLHRSTPLEKEASSHRPEKKR